MINQHTVTIKDIAQRLKLSVSTVSRALRGNSEIKPETRRLVKELAAQLNYSPNPIALSLKEKKSRIIGVVVPEIANTFCAATIAGIEDIAYSRGYHVMTFQSHERYEREVSNVRLLASRRIDGLIISISNTTREYGHLEEIIEKRIPLVMFDRVCEDIHTHKVMVNDYQGAFDAVQHLAREGFRRIAHITLSPHLSITQHRLKGYQDALRQHGLPLRDEWVVYCDFDSTGIENAIRQLFALSDKPDALFVSAERLAMGCLKMLREMGLRIPEDVGLAGFSDNQLNHLLAPGLTAVKQPTLDIGQKAAELLIDLIENKDEERTYESVTLPTMLDVQGSSQRGR
jgi:LacI family transcriptional regulator